MPSDKEFARDQIKQRIALGIWLTVFLIVFVVGWLGLEDYNEKQRLLALRPMRATEQAGIAGAAGAGSASVVVGLLFWRDLRRWFPW